MTERIIQTAGGVRAHLLAAAIDAQLALAALDERQTVAARHVQRCAATLEAVTHAALPADQVLEAHPLRPRDTLVIRTTDLTTDQLQELWAQLRTAFPARQVAVVVGERVEIEIGPAA